MVKAPGNSSNNKTGNYENEEMASVTQNVRAAFPIGIQEFSEPCMSFKLKYKENWKIIGFENVIYVYIVRTCHGPMLFSDNSLSICCSEFFISDNFSLSFVFWYGNIC